VPTLRRLKGERAVTATSIALFWLLFVKVGIVSKSLTILEPSCSIEGMIGGIIVLAVFSFFYWVLDVDIFERFWRSFDRS
jgi:hypothetical protein